jgi:hypothetical protein
MRVAGARPSGGHLRSVPPTCRGVVFGVSRRSACRSDQAWAATCWVCWCPSGRPGRRPRCRIPPTDPGGSGPTGCAGRGPGRGPARPGGRSLGQRVRQASPQVLSQRGAATSWSYPGLGNLFSSTVRRIVMALAPPGLKNRQRPEPLREGAQLLAVARPSAAGPDHRSACCAGRGCAGGTTILTSPESRS